MSPGKVRVHRPLLVIAGLLFAYGTGAQTRLPNNQQAAPGATHRSFLRDSAANLVGTDRQYIQDIRANWPGNPKVVDAVFQQCFGGGFVARFEIDAPAAPANQQILSFTAASASEFNRTSWETYFYNPAAPPPFTFVGLDDFTRAWTEDARHNALFPGPFRWALTGDSGRTAIPTAGVVAVNAFVRTHGENPQFFSPDAMVLGPSGPNNGRVPMHTANSPVYAILAAWSSFNDALVLNVANPDFEIRFAADLTRMYRTLRDDFGVPAENIVVLYLGQAAGTFVPPFTTLWKSQTENETDFDLRSSINAANPNGQGVYVDGPNNRATWLLALQGQLFSPLGANIPGNNARLFLYNTGHGSAAELANVHHQANVAGGGLLSFTAGPDSLDKAPVPQVQPPVGTNGVVAASIGIADECDLQISTTRPLTPGFQVHIDGNTLPASPLEVAPGTEWDLGEFVPATNGLHHYQVSFSRTNYSALDPQVHIDLANTGDADSDGELLAAVVIRSSSSEYLGTLDPRPDISIVLNPDGRATIIWTGTGQLQGANNLSGPWIAIPSATSPYTTSIMPGMSLYRVFAP